MPLEMINYIDSIGYSPFPGPGGITLLSIWFQASFKQNKMTLKMINRIDRKGIPPGLGQGEYPSFQYGFNQVLN